MAQVLTCPVPNNINPLSPNGFKFTIQKAPHLTYFAQEVTLPGITLGEPEYGTPFARVPVPGETLTYDQLDVRFLVDERMLNYKTIYNWLIALGFPESHQQYVDFKSEDDRNIISELARNYSDGTLEILSNTNGTNQTVGFFDMFPTNISSLSFQSAVDDVTYLGATATFRFSYYKFL